MHASLDIRLASLLGCSGVYVMSCRVLSRHATPPHATPRHATQRHATPHHATPRHATPYRATLHQVDIRHDVASHHVIMLHCTARYCTRKPYTIPLQWILCAVVGREIAPNCATNDLRPLARPVRADPGLQGLPSGPK